MGTGVLLDAVIEGGAWRECARASDIRQSGRRRGRDQGAGHASGHWQAEHGRSQGPWATRCSSPHHR
eukprot:3935642-Rhodomonas_salina.1